MTIERKPSKNLQHILSELYCRALATDGAPVSRRLTNNLIIDLRVKGGIVALLISRSSVYPSIVEWKTILRHWPYPVQCDPDKQVRSQTDGQCRHYLRGHWPLQSSFALGDSDRSDSEPVNVYASDVGS